MKDVEPVVNIHYDNMIRVEGNIDKDFSKILPNYLKKSCTYTINELNRQRRQLR